MVNGYLADSLEEALKIRSEQTVIPYAGGTDLMIANRQEAPYLFIGKLEELKQITVDENYVRIGGAVTFTQALGSDLIPPLMKEALSRIAAPAIRNAGTFAGNIGNGSAKADSVLIEYAADAKICLRSLRGERIVDIDQFYLGRKKLDLKEDELITEILLPKAGLENYYYKKVGGRNALAISRVAFTGIIRINNGTIESFAAAFGAVAGTVLRFKDLEKQLVGKTLDEAKEMKKDILDAYAEKMVLTKGRVSAEYRKTVCMNLLGDFMEEKGI
ncbi:MAG TPA: FAD binding domain-containing protein [Lachnospiraceae bacterium]|nr:FAD binding domain-containing protein [Lachnospiraceae bacterium]